MAAGLGVSEGIAAATGLDTHVKWPNDVCAPGRVPRKLAGLLAEAGSAGDRVLHVVLGIGINVLPAAYPPDVAPRAASLEGELGRAVPPRPGAGRMPGGAVAPLRDARGW